MNDRKKNNFDPIAKPVYFFRKPYTPHKDISVVTLYEKLGFDLEEKENRPNKNMPFNLTKKDYKITNNRTINSQVNKKLIYEEIKMKGKFRYNKIDNMGFDKKKEENNGFISAPTIKGNSEEDYIELKSKLLRVIVDNRIYKEEVLNDLLERTIILNPHLEQSKIEEVFQFLMEELEQ